MISPSAPPAWRRITVTTLGLAVSCILAGCAREASSRGSARGGSVAVPVQIAQASVEDVPRTIESIGSVQALRKVAISSRVEGVIARVEFTEGDEVAAGDLLVTLDQAPFENNLRMARADLANARAQAATAEEDERRYDQLGRDQAISQEQVAQLRTKAQTTRAQVQSREAAVANAELQLSYTEIRAPIAGRTGQLLLHEGANVKANDTNLAIVTINQLAPVAVAFSVPEPALEEVRRALQNSTVTVVATDRGADREFTDGRLRFIDNSVNPDTGTITLKAEFPNADHALWPGEFLFVRTTVGVDARAVVVPGSAVMTGQDGTSVFVVKADRTVELRPVRVLRTVGERVVLADGVHGGETVVTDGQLRLVPGARIEAKALGAPASAHVAVDEKPGTTPAPPP